VRLGAAASAGRRALLVRGQSEPIGAPGERVAQRSPASRPASDRCAGAGAPQRQGGPERARRRERRGELLPIDGYVYTVAGEESAEGPNLRALRRTSCTRKRKRGRTDASLTSSILAPSTALFAALLVRRCRPAPSPAPRRAALAEEAKRSERSDQEPVEMTFATSARGALASSGPRAGAHEVRGCGR